MNITDLFTSSIETARAAATLAVNILVQSSLIIVAGLLAARLLRSHGAAVQSTVLRVTLVAVIACPFASWMLASAGVSGFGVQLPRAPVATLTSEPEVAALSVADGAEMNDAGGGFTHDEPTIDVSEVASLQKSATSPLKSHELSYPHGRSSQAADPDATESTVETVPPQSERNGRRIASIPLIAWMYGAAGVAWSLIALLLLARLFVANLFVWRGRARAEAADAGAISACERLARAIGVQTPATRISSYIQSPCLVGVVRPTILLPVTVRPVSRDVLVHELAHLRRQDCLWQLVSCLTTAAFWFQPLLWQLGRRLEQAADDVADDFVVQFGNDRTEYARQLVDIAQRYQPEWSASCVGAGIVSFKSSLAKRVVRILDTSRSLSTRTGLAALTAIVLFGTTGTIGVGLLGTGAARAERAPQDVVDAEEPANRNILDAVPRTEKESEQITGAGRVDLPTEATKLRHITGIVQGPDGKLFAGASVFIGPGDARGDDGGIRVADPIEVKSETNGRFEVSYRERDFFENPEAVPKMMWDLLGDAVYIVATAPGFGPGWIRGRDLKEGNTVILQLVADAPIEGQLVTIEGAPAANVRVQLEMIQAAPDNNVEPWLDSLRAGTSMWMASVEHKHQNIAPNVFRMSSHLTTDDEGRFRIAGIGRDRIVRLFLKGPTVARTVFRVVAREMEPLPTNLRSADMDGDKVYGAKFKRLVAPSQPIVGILRDAKTGEPLPRVAIESYQFAGSNTMGNRTNLLRVQTDAAGRFRLEGMPKGRGNRLLAVPNDDQPYFMREIPIPETEGLDPIRVEVEMHRGIWITGKVIDQVTREPVMASLKYLPFLSNKYTQDLPEFTTIGNGQVEGGLGYQHRYVTKPDGSFRLVGLPGRAVVGAETMSKHRRGAGSEKIDGMDADGRLPTYSSPLRAANNWPNTMVEINPAADAESVSITLEADPGSRVQINVTDAEGKPITGYRVSGQVTSSSWGEPIDQPAFAVTGMAPSEARTILIQHAERRLGKAVRVTNEKRELTAKLEQCAVVHGRLVDADGDPVAKATLRAFTQPTEDYNPYLQPISSDDQGRFEFAAVPIGIAYRIQVRTLQGSTQNNIAQFDPKANETVALGDVKLRSRSGTRAGQATERTQTDEADATKTRAAKPGPTANSGPGRVVRGGVFNSDGKPVSGAFVAVVGLNVQPKPSATDRSPWGELLAEATTGSDGKFALRLGDVSSKTHIYPSLIARSTDSAIVWQRLDLDAAESDVKMSLKPQQLIRVRLVDIEGLPAAGLSIGLAGIVVTTAGKPPSIHYGFPSLEQPPKAWLSPVTTDEQGNFTIRNVAAGHGLFLKIAGTDRFAPQDLALNTGMSEQRGEHDGTYRSLVKNLKPGEAATIALAPAQFFEGVVLLGDSGKPAANARITMWASQQESAGSMISIEGKTDGEGRFRLNPNPGVRFGIIAYPPHGSPYQVRRLNDLRWESGEASKSIEIRLDQGVLARGWVVDAKTAQPLRGASVQYHPDRINNKNITSDIVTGWQSIQKTNDEGEFQITVLAGPGTLLIHAADGSYILQEMGSRELDQGKPGGARTYAHAFRKINPSASEPLEAMKIELQPGASVEGTLTDQKGNPIDRAVVVSRLKILDHSPQWRGFPDEALNGKFEIKGLRDGEEYPVYFLDPMNRLGAAATINTKNASPKIVLKPCGSAKARFVNSDGKPVESGLQLGLHMVVTPGKPKYDFRAIRRGETLADEDFVSNIDQVNYRPSPKTNDNGEVTFPALIPGARYRFLNFVNGDPQVSKEFTAKSGETYDMGDIEVQINQ